MLSLLVFIGEAVRDAFDPRKTFASDAGGAAEDASEAVARAPGAGAGIAPGAGAAASEDDDEAAPEAVTPGTAALAFGDAATAVSGARGSAPGPGTALLAIDDLGVRFGSGPDAVEAVDGVSLTIRKGETVALVGESGSGKSATALSVLQLLPYPAASHPRGSIRFQGTELLGAAPGKLQEIRGDRIAMIFQEPMTSLNPLHTIARQIGETLKLHKGLDGAAATERTLELLRLVGIVEPERRLGAYPHELSGGQRQRMMIAMALANEPDLLIADEPTTALDVTIQAQLLELLVSLQRRLGMAILFITHDMGIVQRLADRLCIMQRGKIVEAGATAEVMERPRHPYTRHLLAATPSGAPAPPDAAGDALLACDDLKVWYPIKAGILRRTVDHVRAVDGISMELRPARPWAWWARAVRARPRWGWRCCVSWAAAARCATTAGRSRGCARGRCGRCGGTCRWCSRTPTGRSTRAFRWRRSSRKAWWCTGSGARARSGTASSSKPCAKWNSTPTRATATPMSSPAASASASPSPAPWC